MLLQSGLQLGLVHPRRPVTPGSKGEGFARLSPGCRSRQFLTLLLGKQGKGEPAGLPSAPHPAAGQAG